jgi:hypothetical protein
MKEEFAPNVRWRCICGMQGEGRAELFEHCAEHAEIELALFDVPNRSDFPLRVAFAPNH